MEMINKVFLLVVLSYQYLYGEALDLDHAPTNKELLQMVQNMNGTIQRLEYELKGLKNNQLVAFWARLEKADITLGSQQTVVFNQVLSNAGNGYDAMHGHFTAPIAGMYQFVVTMMCNPEKIVYVELVKDGQFVSRIFAQGHYYSSTTETAIIQLTVGDKVWVREENKENIGEVLHGYWCNFSGHLLN